MHMPLCIYTQVEIPHQLLLIKTCTNISNKRLHLLVVTVTQELYALLINKKKDLFKTFKGTLT